MRRSHIVLGLGGLIAGLAIAGLVAAQDANKTAPAPVAVPTPPNATATAPAPVTTAVPNTPQAKALANAVTPDEGPAPPKVEAAPVIRPVEPPPEAKAPAEPMKRIRYNAAVMQAVDKLTAETLRFETKVGEPVRFKGLVLTVRACETTAPDEPAPDNIAFVDAQSQPITTSRVSAPPRQVFRGWMFANSPDLHPFEHPIYDVWLIACKTATPDVVAPMAPNTPPPPAKAPAKRS